MNILRSPINKSYNKSLASMTDNSLLQNLPGVYTGNVGGTFLNVGSLAKTGKIYITNTPTRLSISSESSLKKNVATEIPLSELTPYFNEKKTVMTLPDGTIEERVAFERYVSDDYGF